MSECSVTIVPALPDHQPAIEAILDRAFGLARHTKTSYRFREGETAVPGLSFAAVLPDGGIAGAISFWHLRIGDDGRPALLLGPLAVDPALQARGIGRALMRHGIAEAQRLGHELIILVGDMPYYARVGFARVPDGKLLMPGPVDPDRLLYLELAAGSLAACNGLVLPPSRFAATA